jgi:hypothetical protein
MWNFPPAVFVQACIINGFFGLCTASSPISSMSAGRLA